MVASSHTLNYNAPSTVSIETIIGVDEVGRGCQYGPVVVAGVVLPANFLELVESTKGIRIDDSKKLSGLQRKRSIDFIMKHAISISVVYGSPIQVDNYNILKTTMYCMSQVIDDAPGVVRFALIDGDKFQPSMIERAEIGYTTVVKGDSLSTQIAAASIVAKHARDKYIEDLVDANPGLIDYDIRSRKGYYSPKYNAQVTSAGAPFLHRYSYHIKALQPLYDTHGPRLFANEDLTKDKIVDVEYFSDVDLSETTDRLKLAQLRR